jgi:hypothetical protein
VTAAAPPAPLPRDELLRFVPDDMGFCLVVQDVRRHAAALAASPFAQHFLRSGPGKGLLRSAELRKLEAVDRLIAKQVGVGWAELRDDVLGEAIVLAYRPGPPGKPQQEQGLILVRARTARALHHVVERLNAVQKETGELRELVECDHKGTKYYKRVERNQVNYYYLRGPILLFTGQEDVLRAALEREQSSPSLSPPVTARLRKLGIERSLLALWINPRAWDAEVLGRAAKATEVGPRTFAVYWKALQDVGVAVKLDRDLSVSLAFRAETDKLPASARKFLAEASRPSEVWRNCPDNALLAAGGRIDVAALFELLGEFMTKKARETVQADLAPLSAVLDRNIIKEVLPNIGPDWGVCITAPPAEDKNWGPRMLLALRVAPGPEAPVDQALLSALRTWAVFGVLAHNKQHPDRPVRLKSTIVNKVRVQYLEGDNAFPPGIQPAFALKGGYVVLASSVDEVRRFGTGPAPAATGSVPLLRISFKDWRAYLKDRSEPLAGALAERDKITREQARARLDHLRTALELIDRLELRQRSSAGQVTFTLALTTGRPLRK